MQSSTELTVLGWNVVLLLVHIVVQTLALIRDCGPSYALSNRDGSRVPGPVTHRLTRGLANFLETYAAFVGLALALAVSGKAGGLGATGAVIWFWPGWSMFPSLLPAFRCCALWSGRSR